MIEQLKEKIKAYYVNDDIDKVLDCITTLQQDLDKANDVIEKDRQFYKCRMDEYVELKKENETLKAKLEIGKTCGFCPYYDYKSRCEKAIEYINKMWLAKLTPDIVSKTKGDLLNILNGVDENE